MHKERSFPPAHTSPLMPSSSEKTTSAPDQQDPELIQEQARAWLLRITSKSMTPDEAETFKRWCAQSQLHARTFAETSRTWRLLGAAAELNADTHKLQQPNQFNRRHFLAAAASLAGIAVVTQIGMPTGISLGSDNSLQTAKGEQKNLDISADIAITLNTLTHVELLETDTGLNQHRVRLLNGEMDVRCAPHSKGINVLAGGGQVASSDAHFNIRHINDSVQVTCMQGQAHVTSQGNRARVNSGEQVQYSAAAFTTPKRVDTNSVGTWINRILVFDNIPLETVIEEVNRYRSGKILLLNSQVAKRKVQARFELDRLDEVITVLTNIYDIKSVFLPGGIVVLT